jgi:hypothetical protein
MFRDSGNVDPGTASGNRELLWQWRIAMLFFYLPMIIFGAMFETNANRRAATVPHTHDAQ